jgi:hypothetical protein
LSEVDAGSREEKRIILIQSEPIWL